MGLCKLASGNFNMQNGVAQKKMLIKLTKLPFCHPAKIRDIALSHGNYFTQKSTGISGYRQYTVCATSIKNKKCYTVN